MEFTDIALAKFLQAAPELGPLIINFQEVTEEIEDANGGTKVGVFILRAGNGLITVPVISKGDTVFPIDSVFIESEGLFRPLSSATINYILNSNNSNPGKVTKIPDTVTTNPNVNSLINPPRTGKFVYSSASRLSEFLAVLPKPVKDFVFEKIAGEQSLYNSLDKAFGLRAIFAVLNGADGGSGQTNSSATGPDPLKINNISVITSPYEIAALKNDAMSELFMEHGFAMSGNPGVFRTAVAYQPYNQIGNYDVVNPTIDGGRDFSIVMRNGNNKEAFLPKYHIQNPISEDALISVFTDGTYARGNLVSSGDKLERKVVLTTLFDLSPPKLLRELERGEDFLLFTNSGEALGPFYASSVTKTALGVEIKVYGGEVRCICGYQNFTKEVDTIGGSLFVPSNVLVLTLGSDISDQVERSVFNAADKKEAITMQFLNAELDLRHDGVEFYSNGQPLGKFASAIKNLVEVEHIEPESAVNFLKQAEEIKYLKIFMSKKASGPGSDFNPAEVPQYGAVANKTNDVGLNGSFLSSVQNSAQLGDNQAMESTIISQLLQVPELFEYIQEYLPELESSTDRLGRILFLTRVKMDQISNSLDSDSVFSLISQIKTVYRQLGDTSLKLKGISTTSIGFDKDEAVAQTNGR
jgi:hypothetical protein